MHELERYLSSVAALCDMTPEICQHLSLLGLNEASEIWKPYSEEAVRFTLEVVKQGAAKYEFLGDSIGYDSSILAAMLAARDVSFQDLRNRSRSDYVEHRIANDPRMAMFTRSALLAETSYGTAPGSVEDMLKRRRAEVSAIGEAKILADLGLSDGTDVRSLTFSQAMDCITKQFLSYGLTATRTKAGDVVMKYEGPAIGAVAFYLRMGSLPGFEYYFSCDISVGASNDLSVFVDGAERVFKAKTINASLRELVWGLGAYTSSPTKEEFLGSLYMLVKVIPLAIRPFLVADFN